MKFQIISIPIVCLILSGCSFLVRTTSYVPVNKSEWKMTTETFGNIYCTKNIWLSEEKDSLFLSVTGGKPYLMFMFGPPYIPAIPNFLLPFQLGQIGQRSMFFSMAIKSKSDLAQFDAHEIKFLFNDSILIKPVINKWMPGKTSNENNNVMYHFEFSNIPSGKIKTMKIEFNQSHYPELTTIVLKRKSLLHYAGYDWVPGV